MNNEILHYGGAMSEPIRLRTPGLRNKVAEKGDCTRQSAKARQLATHASDWRPLGQGLAPRPPNLLILGASGHVAQAFLLRLQDRRSKFGRLVLLDRSRAVLGNPHLRHDELNYEFIEFSLRLPEATGFYHQFLVARQIDIVVDLTDLDTLPILEATDAAGVSYVNTALNDSAQGVAGVLAAIHPRREHPHRAAHIISSGMNPGVVNIWVWDAFKKFGAPKEIIHFEYDTSVPVTGWRPMVTWSRQEFLTETVWERTGFVKDGELRLLYGNALGNRLDMAPVMKPLVSLPSYPRGMLVLHEENVKLGQKLGASSKYLYAIHPRTMDYLEQLWNTRGQVGIDDLAVGDNISMPLTGSDTIGVCLEYADKRAYYLHSLDNEEVSGTNATCAQVAVGAEAALSTLLSENLEPRIYFASDLYGTSYRDFVFQHLRVDHVVLEKAKPRPRRRRADTLRAKQPQLAVPVAP